MKHTGFAAAALFGSALALAACSDEPAADAAGEDAAVAELSATEGRLVLPAVSGNPGAVYFTVHNDGDRERFIRGASVEGAQGAMLHQMGTWNKQPSMDEVLQIGVPAGGVLEFEPGGLHVMADGLDETLAAGDQTQVTLNFIGGQTLTFPVAVRAAGDER